MPFSETRHLYYGATYLLEKLADDIGLTKDLKLCFPDKYMQLLSIAFYLILEDNNPLYRFEKWHLTHKHPYGEDISSPRSSEDELAFDKRIASLLFPSAICSLMIILNLSSTTKTGV